MPASEAQIRANKLNAQKSTGPKTEEGKEASRANAYKHGLTARTVLPEREAAEVERRYQTFCEQLNPSGEVGYCLARLASQLSLRVERCAMYETAVMTDRVRQAEADFVPPEGADPAQIARLRAHAAELALFDTSKEAILARKYQAAAERSFLRVLKELREHEKYLKAEEKATLDEFEREILASNFSEDDLETELAAMGRNVALPTARKPVRPIDSVQLGTNPGQVDVPIAVGRRR